MIYQKAKVEVLHNMPVAGGCGDNVPSMCHAMTASNHGPGCGATVPSMCYSMTYMR